MGVLNFLCYSSAYYLISQVICIKYWILTSASLGGAAASSPGRRPGWEDKQTLVLERHLVEDRGSVDLIQQGWDSIYSEQIYPSKYIVIHLSTSQIHATEINSTLEVHLIFESLESLPTCQSGQVHDHFLHATKTSYVNVRSHWNWPYALN